MEDLQQLELLSLVAKISQEVLNYTGINDKTLAEFIIGIRPHFLWRDNGAEYTFKLCTMIRRLLLSSSKK
jgi:ATP-dependent RNA helicase DHX8/PRP22